MRIVYAFQCEVLPDAGQPVAALHEALVGEAEAWLRDNLRDEEGRPPEAVVPEVRAEWQEVEGRRRALLEEAYPDGKDETLLWSLGWSLTATGRGVEVSVLMGFFSGRFQVRPTEFGPVALSYVPQLVSRRRCQIDGQPVPTRPRELPAGDVERFVRNSLCQPRRALPTVLLSPDPETSRPALAPEPLQQRLLGFAEVVVLTDNSAVAALTRCVGPERTCCAGAARVYWPGFTKEADPNRYPFRLPQQLTQDAARGHPPDRHLLSMFISAAADRVCVPRLAAPVREAAPDQSAEIDRLRAETARLAEEAVAARQEATRLKAELDRLRAEFAARWAVDPPPLPSPKPGLRPPRRPRPVHRRDENSFASVADALAAAAQRFDDVLTVWDDAMKAAQRCDSNRGNAVFRALEAVAAVGRQYFEARQAGRPMGAIDEALSQRVPFKYSARESPTTMGQFGQDRVFRHKGRSRLMVRHLTLARGDHKNSVQIYFEFDDESGRVDVGYCGRHLPVASVPT